MPIIPLEVLFVTLKDALCALIYALNYCFKRAIISNKYRACQFFISYNSYLDGLWGIVILCRISSFRQRRSCKECLGRKDCAVIRVDRLPDMIYHIREQDFSLLRLLLLYFSHKSICLLLDSTVPIYSRRPYIQSLVMIVGAGLAYRSILSCQVDTLKF